MRADITARERKFGHIMTARSCGFRLQENGSSRHRYGSIGTAGASGSALPYFSGDAMRLSRSRRVAVLFTAMGSALGSASLEACDLDRSSLGLPMSTIDDPSSDASDASAEHADDAGKITS